MAQSNSLPEGYQEPPLPTAPDQTTQQSSLPQGYQEPPPPESGDVNVPMAEQIHNIRVQRALPAARANVSNEPAFMSLVQGQDVPIVGPLVTRAASAGAAALGYGEGEDFSTRYANQLASHQARALAQREQHPYLSGVGSTASQVLGGAAQVALAPEMGVGAALSEISPMALKAVSRLAGPAIEGGLWGAGMSGVESTPGESPAETAARIARGAVFGGAAGAAIPLIKSGLMGAARSFMWDPEGALASAAAKNPNAPGLTMQQYLAAKEAGQPVNMADVKGAKSLLEDAGGRVPNDANWGALQRDLRDRFENRSMLLGEGIDNAMGINVDGSAIRRASKEAARAENPSAYKAAYEHPNAQNMWNPQLQAILNTEEGNSALQFALNESKKRQATTGEPGFQNPFIKNKFGDWELPFYSSNGPNLEFWDMFKRGLQEVHQTQKKSGMGTTAYNTGEMSNSLRDYLTTTVEPYGPALSGAGKYIRADNAFDAGAQFARTADVARKTADPKEIGTQLYNFHNLFTDTEKEHFALGLAASLKENPKQSASIFGGGDAVTLGRFKSVLGEDKFNAIDSAFTIHRLASATQHLQAGPPNPIVERATTYGSPAAVAAAAIYNPESFANLKTAALGAVGAGLGKIYTVTQQNRATELLRMANSKDPAVLESLQRAAAQSPATHQMLKTLEEGMTRAAIARAANTGGASYDQRAQGGRIPRKTGGKVSDSAKHERLLGRLMALTEKAKRTEEASTKPLLNAPDEAIVHALHVANAAI